MPRPAGFYWVRDSIFGWEIAKWDPQWAELYPNEEARGWLTCGDDVVTRDGDYEEIGARVER